MRRWSLAASSPHSAYLQMIPMNAKTQVTAAYVVIVAMVSMGRKLARHRPFPAVPKVTECAGTDMTLVTNRPTVASGLPTCALGRGAARVSLMAEAGSR
jgi:hypothetical protein